MSCVVVVRNNLAVHHIELGVLQELQGSGLLLCLRELIALLEIIAFLLVCI